MKAVVYDTGVLIAADRSERRTWAEHRVRLEAGIIPLVPSPVVAQASRTPKQVQLRRLLRGCEVVAFDEAAAHAAGSLLGKARTKDVVDASVALLSIRRGADVVSDDVDDIERLLSAARAKASIPTILDPSTPSNPRGSKTVRRHSRTLKARPGGRRFSQGLRTSSAPS